MPALYLDTSAILRPILEKGTSPEVEDRILGATRLITSRLTSVEAARAVLRERRSGQISEVRLTEIERDIDRLWTRCDFWEISRRICDTARIVAPTKWLRALDAIHLATFITARRRLPDLELLTADDRLRAAAEGV